MDIPDFFCRLLEEQYGKDLTLKIIEGFKVKRKTTLRVNTLKSSVEKIEEKLIDKGIKFQKVPWCNEALIISEASENEIEALDFYKNGDVYLQSLSSMLPPIILNPKENEDILDMAAAPGGKTTQIAAITCNKAHITACEMNKVRLERLKYNIQKQGASSVYVMETDSRRLNDYFSFDKILLDSPCSGSGTLNLQNKDIDKYFTQKLIDKCKKTQLELLKKAIRVLKPKSEMVYSTCSILAGENEDIVNKIIQKENCEIVPIETEKFKDILLLPSKIEGTLTVCPTNLYEGFFIAKIYKKG